MSEKIIISDLAVNSYITAALWTAELDDFSIDDLTNESLELCKKEVIDFIDKASSLLDDNNAFETLNMVGHDFWLTRNGHGAGFWDKDYTNKDALTELAQTFPERFVFVQDKKIIFE